MYVIFSLFESPLSKMSPGLRCYSNLSSSVLSAQF